MKRQQIFQRRALEVFWEAIELMRKYDLGYKAWSCTQEALVEQVREMSLPCVMEHYYLDGPGGPLMHAVADAIDDIQMSVIIALRECGLNDCIVDTPRFFHRFNGAFLRSMRELSDKNWTGFRTPPLAIWAFHEFLQRIREMCGIRVEMYVSPVVDKDDDRYQVEWEAA